MATPGERARNEHKKQEKTESCAAAFEAELQDISALVEEAEAAHAAGVPDKKIVVDTVADMTERITQKNNARREQHEQRVARVLQLYKDLKCDSMRDGLDAIEMRWEEHMMEVKRRNQKQLRLIENNSPQRLERKKLQMADLEHMKYGQWEEMAKFAEKEILHKGWPPRMLEQSRSIFHQQMARLVGSWPPPWTEEAQQGTGSIVYDDGVLYSNNRNDNLARDEQVCDEDTNKDSC